MNITGLGIVSNAWQAAEAKGAISLQDIAQAQSPLADSFAKLRATRNQAQFQGDSINRDLIEIVRADYTQVIFQAKNFLSQGDLVVAQYFADFLNSSRSLFDLLRLIDDLVHVAGKEYNKIND